MVYIATFKYMQNCTNVLWSTHFRNQSARTTQYLLGLYKSKNKKKKPAQYSSSFVMWLLLLCVSFYVLSSSLPQSVRYINLFLSRNYENCSGERVSVCTWDSVVGAIEFVSDFCRLGRCMYAPVTVENISMVRFVYFFSYLWILCFFLYYFFYVFFVRFCCIFISSCCRRWVLYLCGGNRINEQQQQQKNARAHSLTTNIIAIEIETIPYMCTCFVLSRSLASFYLSMWLCCIRICSLFV